MKLSIITINYNNATGLKRTLDSVAKQIWTDFEHIIIDGGSKDDSVEIIREYAKSNSFKYHIKWISEQDSGIYDAMNKGIALSEGKYCLFLNGGDKLSNKNVINDIVSLGLQADIVCGDSIFEASKLHSTRNIISPDTIRASYLILSYLPHQSSFIKRKLFDNIHKYDTEFRIVSDWLFFIEALLIYRVSYQHIPIVVSHCETEGVSNNPMNCQLMEDEFQRGLSKILPAFKDDYIELRSMRRERLTPKYNFLMQLDKSYIFKILWNIQKIKKILYKLWQRN